MKTKKQGLLCKPLSASYEFYEVARNLGANSRQPLSASSVLFCLGDVLLDLLPLRVVGICLE